MFHKQEMKLSHSFDKNFKEDRKDSFLASAFNDAMELFIEEEDIEI